MEIITTETLGFCKGVDRAAKMTEAVMHKAAKKGLPVYALGKLVHNNIFNQKMEALGLHYLEGKAFVEKPGYLILRTHGVTDNLKKHYLDQGMILVDCACPVVLHEQQQVRVAHDDDFILILGKKNHPEVLSLYGVESKPKRMIINSLDDLKRVPPKVNLYVVMQSTASPLLVNPVLNELENWKKCGRVITIGNRQCNSTAKRLKQVTELAKKVDCVLVIGDKTSANTNGLVEKVTECQTYARLITSVNDIDNSIFAYKRVGVASGASAPMFLIEEILHALQKGELNG